MSNGEKISPQSQSSFSLSRLVVMVSDDPEGFNLQRLTMSGQEVGPSNCNCSAGAAVTFEFGAINKVLISFFSHLIFR